MKTIDFFFDLMTIIRETEIEVEDMIRMVKYEDGYVPEECCTMTNPQTSGGKREPDDVQMPCEGGSACDGECSTCIIQRIMNAYASCTGQNHDSDSLTCSESGLSDQEIRFIKVLYRELVVEDQEASAVRKNITDYLRLETVAGGKDLKRRLRSAAEQQTNDRRNLRF